MKPEAGIVAILDLSPETEKLVEEKARAAGMTPDEVVRRAVTLAPPPPDRESGPRNIDMDAVWAINRRSQARPILDHRTEKEICDEG